eukprot:1878368-Prymnesium_polylepis.1
MNTYIRLVAGDRCVRRGDGSSAVSSVEGDRKNTVIDTERSVRAFRRQSGRPPRRHDSGTAQCPLPSAALLECPQLTAIKVPMWSMLQAHKDLLNKNSGSTLLFTATTRS